MFKYTFFSWFLFLYCWNAKAQNNVITGSLETNNESTIITNVAVTQDNYFFVNSNLKGSERTISIFKTTNNLKLEDSIEDFAIRGFETKFLSLFKVFSDRILMVSNAQTETGNYIYTHSIDLKLNNHTIIDSLEIDFDKEFTSHEYKFLNESTLYTVGNISQLNQGLTLSTHYFEIDTSGEIKKFETIQDHNQLILTFDYNPDMDQYIIAEPGTLNLVNSKFSIIDRYPVRLPIPVGNSPDIVMFIGSCQFVNQELVECIGSSQGPAEIYSNISAYFNLNQDKIHYESAIPLHPDTVDNLKTRLVETTADEQGNRYFAYYEPFNPIDDIVVPNKVFISKFDKDFNNLYFLELLDNQEHGFEDIMVDKQGNLLVVGTATPPENASVFTNSYIKISENGELLTSTGNIFQPEKIDVYPNPTTDYITLNIDKTTTDVKYFIYSLDGRQVAYGNISFGDKLCVETNALPRGMYILHAEYDGFIKIAKFVKK